MRKTRAKSNPATARALTFAPIATRPENQIRLVTRQSLAVGLTVEERAETWVVFLLATTSYFYRSHHSQVPVA
jgi:hypothetical protein